MFDDIADYFMEGISWLTGGARPYPRSVRRAYILGWPLLMPLRLIIIAVVVWTVLMLFIIASADTMWEDFSGWLFSRYDYIRDAWNRP